MDPNQAFAAWPSGTFHFSQRLRPDPAAATADLPTLLRFTAPNILVDLGNVYRQQHRLEDAVVAFRQAIASSPYDQEAYHCLASILYVMGERTEVVTLLRQWLAVDPENPTARHLITAYTEEDLPERASDPYVRQVFDSSAPAFAEVLLGKLAYRAPQLVADRLAALVGPADASLSMLDAGCGTGLCAPLIKPYARNLVGVDLSPGMLDRARLTGLYDELVESELTAFMAAREAAFDLIVAADTLCYFGALPPVFRAAARTLRRGGRLVFTLERAEDEVQDQGFTLDVHGRYAHSEAPVRAALAEAGFVDVTIATAVLRKELRKDVVGLLVSARR